MTTTTTTPSIPFGSLSGALEGALHLPGSEGYARLSTPWNVSVAARPVAVVEAATAADVAVAVGWARERNVRVAVRCTGHGAADELDDTLLVHTGRLKELHIDADGRARVGAGLTWAPVIDAAARRGLAPVTGSAPGVGVVGFLTGGGVGPISGTYGLGSDHVRAFEVVTGDGRLRRATATEHRSLFRALRGGKGAAGIVTAVEIDLVPLRTLYGGALYFDGADAGQVLQAWARWSADLPEAATTSLAVLRLPPLPTVPAPLAGRTTVAVRFAWTGDAAEGEQVLAPLRRIAPVVFGGVAEMPAAAVGMIHADPVDPMPTSERAALLAALPADAVDAVLKAAGPDSGSSLLVVELRRFGGAIGRRDAVGDLVSARDSAYSLLAIGIAAGPAAAATRDAAERLMAAAAPWSTGRQLPNFAPSTDPERVLAVYDPSALADLSTVLATYDPDGVLADADPVRAASMLRFG